MKFKAALLGALIVTGYFSTTLILTHHTRAEEQKSKQAKSSSVVYSTIPMLYAKAPDFSSKAGVKRLENLQKKKKLIEDHLLSIEAAILATLPDKATIPDMTRVNWEKYLDKQSKRNKFQGYEIRLWHITKRWRMDYQSLGCNIFCSNQIAPVPVGPTFTITDFDKDIRFDWYVKTGDSVLNRKIQAIIREKAKAL